MAPSPSSSPSSSSPHQTQALIPSDNPSPDSPKALQVQSISPALLPLPPPPVLSSNPPKKPQPLPWTHDETTNLIRAYQEKWYSLKRGQLKASQWEDVSITVAARCGFEIPSKSGTQCRHKVEKLRKRYRAEKQKPYPHSWLYFDMMDQLERGPLPISVAPPNSSAKAHGVAVDDDDDSEDEIDYGSHKSAKLDRKFEGSRSSRVPKLDEFEELIDGFFKGGGNTNEFSERGRKAVNFAQESRFRKRKASTFEEEEEEELEGERAIAGEEEKKNGMVVQLAGQMKDFAERFVKMERKKMEMMRETERFRMEMENKRMEMILVSQQKTVELISRAFDSQKKMKVTQEV